MTVYQGPERRRGFILLSLPTTLAWSFGIATFSLFLILGALAYGIINTNNRAKEVQEEQGTIAVCLLQQLNEHRLATDEHHKKSAEQHNSVFITPNDLSVPTFNIDPDVCAEYIESRDEQVP